MKKKLELKMDSKMMQLLSRDELSKLMGGFDYPNGGGSRRGSFKQSDVPIRSGVMSSGSSADSVRYCVKSC